MSGNQAWSCSLFSLRCTCPVSSLPHPSLWVPILGKGQWIGIFFFLFSTGRETGNDLTPSDLQESFHNNVIMAVHTYVEKSECSSLPACQLIPRIQRREYAEEAGNKQNLIPSERKQEEMMPPRVDSESWRLLGLLLGWCSLCITHLSQGCAQGHKQALPIDGGTSISALQKKSCTEMRAETQKGGKERGRDQERQRKKWGENRSIIAVHVNIAPDGWPHTNW